MIPYKEFAKHLTNNNIIATPAELHGHACGMIIVNKDVTPKQWVDLILSDYSFEGSDDGKLLPVLNALFNYANDKLSADNYSFALLLPQDDEELSYRLEAMASWCSACLTGMAFAGLKSDADMPKDAHDFILDLDKISQIDTFSDETQGEEADFVEIVEYLKAGCLLLMSEFRENELT